MSLIAEKWNKNFIRNELCVALLLGVLFYVWYGHCNPPLLMNLLKDNRPAIYGTLATIFATLLGFSITAISIVLSFMSDEKFEIIRRSSHYSDLWKVFTSSIRAFSSATIISMLALVIDKNDSPFPPIFFITVFAIILSCFRVFRVIWVIEKIVYIEINNNKKNGPQ